MSNFQKPQKNPGRIRELREFPAIGGDEYEEAPQGQRSQYGEERFVVTPEEEERLKQARQEKLRGDVPLKMKTRVEYLADLGSMSRDVKIAENTFTLRTLKSREQKAVFLSFVNATNQVEIAYNLKLQSLAYSLIKMDGQDFGAITGAETFEQRIELLESMEGAVTNKLFEEFNELTNETEKSFAVKDDKDATEVAEALKK